MNTQNADIVSANIADEIFSPVIHKWISNLHQFICYYNDGDTQFLFNARAGVRIRHLYSLFLEGRGLSMDDSFSMFWASRLSVAKGTFARQPARSVELIRREYEYAPLSDLIAGVLRNNPEMLNRINFSDKSLALLGAQFPQWLSSGAAPARILQSYFRDSSAAMDDYVAKLMGNRRRAVLIDSGWQGTAQTLLADSFPQYSWKGLYFGRSFLPGHQAERGRDIIGLLFENDYYDPQQPESAFIRHRHLIESLLEPNAPSIEEIPSGKFLSLVQPAIDSNIADEPDIAKDFHYARAVAYFQCHAGLSDVEILMRYQDAMPKLARIIVHPSAIEAAALLSKERSADFGKELLVPVLLSPSEVDHGLSRQQRIKDALWQEGQIALEYKGDTRSAFEQQAEVALTGHPEQHSAPPDTLPSQRSINDVHLVKPIVAIITRTKNRPILLKRAAESVAQQTYSDYVWVVVNDGGDPGAVHNVIEQSAVDRRKVVVVNNPISVGMEAASNIGIRAAVSDYIVIHDDDDSWNPDFLKKTLGFLEGKHGLRYSGVITRCEYVSEEIAGDTVIEHGRYPYMEWVRNVHLAEMACGNIFAPISFLYRRRLFDEVGGYNETLPVLGDWYFNLEFLLRADIGVLPEKLAYYHHRDRGGHASSYSNSVIGGISKHEEFLSVASNEFVRRNSVKFPGALAILVGFGVRASRWGFEQLKLHPRGTDHSAQDVEDKYWCAAQFNLTAARHFWSRLTGTKVIDPAQSWEEILGKISRQRSRLPAPPDFDESMYLRLNADVANAVLQKKVPNAYYHYIVFGRREGRTRATR
jgi:glycosyltransferase involved in cell wall biosynthesis